MLDNPTERAILVAKLREGARLGRLNVIPNEAKTIFTVLADWLESCLTT
jgi:hypothetical protein